MDWLVFVVSGGVVAAFAVVAQRRGWIDLSNRNAKRRGGGNVLSIGDEVFHPARLEAQLELDRQTLLPAPAPTPGDGDQDIYTGSVRIDLTESSGRRTPGDP